MELGALVRYILGVDRHRLHQRHRGADRAQSQPRDLFDDIAKMPADFFAQIHMLWLHRESFNPWAFGLGSVYLAGLFVWARIFKPGTFLPREIVEGRRPGWSRACPARSSRWSR